MKYLKSKKQKNKKHTQKKKPGKYNFHCNCVFADEISTNNLLTYIQAGI